MAILSGIHLMPPHQKSLSIYAVWGAGQQSAVNLALGYLQKTCIVGLNNADLIHLVGDGAVKNGEMEQISDLHSVKVSKQNRRGKTAMCGYNAVCALTAHRKTAAL